MTFWLEKSLNQKVRKSNEDALIDLLYYDINFIIIL